MNLHEIPTPLTDAEVLRCEDKYHRLYPDSRNRPVDDDFVKSLERKLTAATRFIKLVSEQDPGDVGAYEAIVKDARETLALITPKP